jgi:hypothetical protein
MNAWDKHVWPYELTLEMGMETLWSVQVKNIPWNEYNICIVEVNCNG